MESCSVTGIRIQIWIWIITYLDPQHCFWVPTFNVIVIFQLQD